MTDRARQVKSLLDSQGLSAFFVTDPVNIYYLTGFRGLSPWEREVLTIVDRHGIHLLLPKMYQSQGRKLTGLKLHVLDERLNLFENALKILLKYRGKLGFEAENLKFNEYQFLKRKIKRLIPKTNFIADLRVIKSKMEVGHIQKAAKIADLAFEQIVKFLKPGITEKQVARKLLEIMEELRSEGPSFEPIVAFGKNSALPHHFTSDRRLKKNEVVLMDFGAKVKGYCSDLTRTLYFGKAPRVFKERYELVRKANEEVVQAAKSSVKASHLHKLACTVLGDEVACFLHSTGHGVGLKIHERPRIHHLVKDKLEEGMVITIEPGLYYEGQFGIRVEDLGVVTKDGFKLLSHAPKEVVELS